jgi:hypothetical protein
VRGKKSVTEISMEPLTSASSLSNQGYLTENPEADNIVQVFRMPESNVHPQVHPSTSEVALLIT